MIPVHVAALAADELREARDWYDRQLKGLGDRFVEAVDVILISVGENPSHFPIIHRDIRRAIVPRFPYGIFFIPEPQRVHVVGVVHLHRHPDSWKRRP